MDFDLHNNIILLNARDVPQDLLHQFINEHDINMDKDQNCKQCQKNHNKEGESIGYFTPCYLHKHKHNKQHYHVKDHKELIKSIEKSCQQVNKQAKKLIHNPIIHTTLVDRTKHLYCSTIIPTNNNHIPITTINLEPIQDSDSIFGVTTAGITIPSSIQCETCNGTHKPNISYNIYNEAFICDRCGYGQNPFDIIYRLSEEDQHVEKECRAIDICCNCAINIANAQEEDNDIYTILEQKQHNHQKQSANTRNNVPMLNTRFIHQQRKPSSNTMFKSSINYSFKQQQPYHGIQAKVKIEQTARSRGTSKQPSPE